MSWDGKDSTGTQLADGTYTFSIAANDSSTGAAETISDMRVVGKVTGVTSNSDGSTNLQIGGVTIPTSTVEMVFSSGSVPTATAGTSNTSS